MNFIQRYFLSQRSLLNESFSSFLTEDKEGKNINKAEKWIKQNHPEVIGKHIRANAHGQIQDVVVTPRFITQEVRNLVPNSRLADCKFLVGATRIYFDEQNADQREFVSKMNKLNKILKIICTAHVDEYDNDLNGMSLEDLDDRFSGAVKADLKADKEKMNSLSLRKRDDYKFVAIDSFEEAKPYGKYTEWCVTHHSDMYENYTKGGIGRFYFCLRDGFEDVPKEKTEGCPMDIYGKSMIAISVNDDGSLNTCTCRWNHDNGGNDNMMTTEEISKFFGVNFYETFKPRSVDEVWKKLLDKRLPDDEFCETFGCIALESPDDDVIRLYKKLIDGKIVTLPKVDDFTTYINGKFMTMKGGKLVEHVPEKIDDDAFFEDLSLTKIEIPHGVKSIGGWAFGGCTSLTSITIPDSVERIGNHAFINCKSLKSIAIPDSVKSIGNHAFYKCISLTSIEIPDSVESIENSTFAECTSLTRVEIPDSVKSIGEWAFWRCNSLEEVVFKGKTLDEVEAMENYSFGIEDESVIKAEM